MQSFIPISRLSASELHMLGNNLEPGSRRTHSQLAAVNRSLAAFGERVARLHQNPAATKRAGKEKLHG